MARFTRIAAKRLREVEVNPGSSNQHELNGVAALRDLLGPDRVDKLPARFVRVGDDRTFASDSWVTWYDARERHETRTEWRLYYPANEVFSAATAGDLLLLLEPERDRIELFVVQAGSSVDDQIRWLLDLGDVDEEIRTYAPEALAQRLHDAGLEELLDALGLEADEDGRAAQLFAQAFPDGMPSTLEFSNWARTMRPADLVDDPDAAIDSWMAAEEALFRSIERLELAERLESGFVVDGSPDIDGFVDFAKSILNRRKARAGHALEHHIRHLLDHRRITYTSSGRTEGNKRPDFLFPGQAAYDAARAGGDSSSLHMLGAKTSCKDRWRQVLSEADLIPDKHLLTLEAPISQSQTDEMSRARLTLVIPAARHDRFAMQQQPALMTVADFFDEVVEVQART